jgi:hypothetical protein
VLEYQIKTAEPLTDRESERSVICDNDGELDIAAIAKRLKALAVS